MTTLRLGELLIRQGLLTPEEVQTTLEVQRAEGGAFGEIAERLFDLNPADVETAWAAQYASIAEPIDPRRLRVEDEAKALLTARQAWQFGIVPLRIESGEAVLCTTKESLPRALRFVYRALGRPCYFLMTDEDSLRETLGAVYPMPGMSRDPSDLREPKKRRAA